MRDERFSGHGGSENSDNIFIVPEQKKSVEIKSKSGSHAESMALLEKYDCYTIAEAVKKLEKSDDPKLARLIRIAIITAQKDGIDWKKDEDTKSFKKAA